MNFKKHILNNKNFKLGYYIQTTLQNLIPNSFFIQKRIKLFQNIHKYDISYLQERINYYNPLDKNVNILSDENILSLQTLVPPKKAKIYYFDIKRFLQYFENNNSFLYVPGDNILLLEKPAFVKSRPIAHSSNEIILKLNAIRHFNFIQDDIPFEKKKNLLFGRMAIYQDVRKRFFETHFHNPICDIGDVAYEMNSLWMKEKKNIAYHLQYKFILALEGNDVATNLKWIMSSNSIAVMPKPRYETWFMEGKLIPDVHYICIKDDFSDLDEKLEYYIQNTDAAKEIIQNAQLWVKQFQNNDRELLLNLMVMDKYFRLTN